MVHRLSDSIFLHQRFTEIVVVLTLVRLELEGFSKVAYGFIIVAAPGQKRAEIAVCHPTIRIARDRLPPKRFDIAVVTTLPPAQ